MQSGDFKKEEYKLIELRCANKSYIENNLILKNINFTMNNGERVAIIGESGSGKSTILNILAMIDNLSSGQYVFDGDDVSNLNDKELSILRNEKVGLIFQDYQLLGNLTVYENITLPAIYAKNTKKTSEIFKTALELIAHLKIEKIANRYINNLSGGEKQRVAIARALVTNPKLILCDEPTGNLDSFNSNIVINTLLELGLSTSIIIVTHNNEIAEKFDVIYKLENKNLILRRQQYNE